MILLIGGFGNVGLNLARYIQLKNKDVTVLGRQEPSIVRKLFPEIKYIYQDVLADKEWAITDEYDIAINLAYANGNFANKVIKENKILMKNLNENSKKFNKVIHISTTAVNGYGSDPRIELNNNYCWDDFYTLAKSTQEIEINKHDYPFHVLRIANFFANDSIFLKSLAILTQLKIKDDDFNFLSDITTTEDIYCELQSSNRKSLINLYHPQNYKWSQILEFTKSTWSISNNIYYDYSDYQYSDNYKLMQRYLTKYIPIKLQSRLEDAIKKNSFLTNIIQENLSNLDLIYPIFRVARIQEESISTDSKIYDKLSMLITSLNQNAESYRLK